MSWKRLITIPLILLANGWSWLTYQVSGYPSDKEVYRANAWQWLDPDMHEHWESLEKSWSFHELKNVGVEYCRLHAQPAAKSLSMFLMLGWIGCFVFMLLSLFLFLYLG